MRTTCTKEVIYRIHFLQQQQQPNQTIGNLVTYIRCMCVCGCFCVESIYFTPEFFFIEKININFYYLNVKYYNRSKSIDRWIDFFLLLLTYLLGYELNLLPLYLFFFKERRKTNKFLKKKV